MLTTGFHWESVAPCESRVIYSLSVLAGIMIVSGYILSLLNPQFIPNFDATQTNNIIIVMFALLFALVMIGLSVYSMYFIVRIFPRTQKAMVAIASDGLWIHMEKWRLIPWDEVTAVGIKLSLRSSQDHIFFGTHCVIAARSAFLWWSIPMTLTDEDPDVSQYPSLESLAQILKATGLPLRDMASISLFGGSPASSGKITYPNLPNGRHYKAVNWVGLRRYLYIMVSGMIGSVMLFAPVMYLMTQVVQPAYFRTLPRALWSIHPAILSKSGLDVGLSLPTFSDQTYTISGSSTGTFAVLPASSQNVAISASVAFVGDGGVGIGTRIPQGSAEASEGGCFLRIQPANQWMSTCDATFGTILAGTMPHSGSGPAKVLLIAHGFGIALYINDQFMGFIEDEFLTNLNQTGHVGLYCLGEHTTCIFSDIAVWKLTGNDNLNWV